MNSPVGCLYLVPLGAVSSVYKSDILLPSSDAGMEDAEASERDTQHALNPLHKPWWIVSTRESMPHCYPTLAGSAALDVEQTAIII